MAEPDREIDRLIEGLRSGDEAVVRRFCDEYGPALHELVERHLRGRLRRRLAAEDVVQSVYRTFLEHIQLKQLRFKDPDTFWRLLCVITLNKLRSRARFHRSARRDVRREVDADSATRADADSTGPGPRSAQAAPDERAAFAELFQLVLDELNEEERQIVDLRLQDYTQEEIAQQLGCSERTVRRIMKQLEGRLARLLGEADDGGAE